MDYKQADDAALYRALLNLGVCPNKDGAKVCRKDLQPVKLFEDVWMCVDCKETWHIPDITV